VPPGAAEERLQHPVVRRAPVVVGAPDPVGPGRQRRQHPEREAAGAAEVAGARQVGHRQPAGADDLLGGLVGTVVDHDDAVHALRLGRDRGEALRELLAPVPGDDDGDDALAVGGGCRHDSPL
jgi:hypothetical protein